MDGLLSHTVLLQGCGYRPLMGYLKALGVLRTVSRQKDPAARGAWRNGHFFIESTLDESAIIDFFITEYEPSPVFSPWNKGSGFYPRGKEGKEPVRVIKALRNHQSPRLRRAAETVILIEKAIKEVFGKEPQNVDDKDLDNKENKTRLMVFCRNVLPDDIVYWLDTVFALSTGRRSGYEPRYAVVMGTGGNDGNMEFSFNFWKSVLDIFDMLGTSRARELLESSLFERNDFPAARKSAIGFFNPFGVGGPNATEGFEGDNLSNPWDLTLTVEGVILLAGSVTRYLDREDLGSVASFPFSVEPVSGGTSIVSDSEAARKASRGELWLPLWERPMSMVELRRLFSEGRAQVGSRTARTGLDFATAVATLGVSRGLSGFIRYGLYERSGRAYLAVPLGVMPVRKSRLEGADRLLELDPWLGRLRPLLANDDLPARVSEIPRRVFSAVFNFINRGDKASLQRLLVAVGKADFALSKISGEKRKVNVSPLRLNRDWAIQCNDGSPEFRIAYALAGIGWTRDRFRPVRTDIQSVEVKMTASGFYRVELKKESAKTLPFYHDFFLLLSSILMRRCLAGKLETEKYTPIESPVTVSLEDVQMFLEGNLDYRKIADLFAGLMLVDSPLPVERLSPTSQQEREPVYSLSRDYVLLKACFLTGPLFIEGEEKPVQFDIEILNLLRARRTRDACQRAAKKLRAKGIIPITNFGLDDIDHERLLASLLIPIDNREFVSRALPLITARIKDAQVREATGGD